ncbi:aldehyde dehydrogenase [Amycolatopsis sp. QT-25]|uniref:aldehyde dehydrogenase n=1 Tax=Amycolatopsis sp. QT-25 TaxID=3034022 RepID=UPI0023EC4534|nr:aldehyde dehydrogenase [Amycolatopsis sp. QT-25]WET83083.1 aldehyde dehydrogenase [Amycolatopsis sp. QT-25]
MTIEYQELLVGGRWTRPEGRSRIEVVSAATEEPLGGVPEGTAADIDRAVAAARAAFDDPRGWAAWSPRRRADVLLRLADALDKRNAETVRRVSTQNGMPVTTGARSEGSAPAALLRYYSALVTEEQAEVPRRGMAGGTIIVRGNPVGVVAAIVPWNFPQTLTFAKLAPALAAGCTVVVKPAPHTVLDAFLLAEAVVEAGLPQGVVSIVPGGAEVGAHLVAHPGVDKVAFTGSTATGRAIAEVCGRLLRPVTLELGGKSAAILLDDVDLPAVLPELAAGTLGNNGQACFLSTRILAPRRRYDEVVDAVTAMAAGLRIGDPLDPATQLGPLVTARQRERVEAFIAAGRAEGGRVTTGGGRPATRERGWYVEPTVFTGLDNHGIVCREEIFGPVLAVLEYENTEQAVALANDTEYGLAGTVWTPDEARGLALARRLRTGTVGVNGYTVDIMAPFGGVKASGLGRELGPEALAAYREPQSVYLPHRDWTGR